MKNSNDFLKQPAPVKAKPRKQREVSGYYGFRGETPIEFNSALHRDFLIRQEFDQEVLDVFVKPCEIAYSIPGGGSNSYTPDYLVYRRLGDLPYGEYPKPLLVDISPREEWRRHWRECLPKWKAAYRYAQEQGWQFHIYDETRVRDQVFANITFLQQFVHMKFAEEESLWILANLRDIGSASFDHVHARHFMGIYKAEGVAHLWHLLATGRLNCDMSMPLNHETELWVATKEREAIPVNDGDTKTIHEMRAVLIRLVTGVSCDAPRSQPDPFLSCEWHEGLTDDALREAMRLLSDEPRHV